MQYSKARSFKISTLLFPLFLIAGTINATAGGKIKAYFNNPVNNAVATIENAVYLPNGTMGDTIVAYINRAKYTIDIAQYDYTQDTYDGAYANIAAAVDSAHARGVTVRWIYDGSSSNSGLHSLDTTIPTLGRPVSSGIMHNKFIIIDAYTPNAGDAILCTGSEDWSSEMIHKDFNNILFIQDSALAHAYTDEFNLMWGSTTDTPNVANSKFGPAKTDLGRHTFYIDGSLVELYFSPTDNTTNHILTSIASANTDLYAGVYCMTQSAMATNIVAKKTSGVYTLVIVDEYTYTASPGVYSILTAGLGAGFKTYSGAYIYHNKMMIVDPSDTCSDPQVLTGSHNWTSSANDDNDENTLIIHNPAIANDYYQSFYANFTSLSGTLNSVNGCGTTGIQQPTAGGETVAIYPNPSNGEISIGYQLTATLNIAVEIFNIIGSKIAQVTENELQNPGLHTYNLSLDKPGIYFARFTFGNEQYTKKIVVTGN